MDENAIQHVREPKNGKVLRLGGAATPQVHDPNGEQRAIAERKSQEKINFHVNDILHVKIDDIPRIIKSFAEWSSQWE